MDLKKVIFISLIAVAILASFSVVSAGFFDFLGGDSHNDTNVDADEITDEDMVINSTTVIECSDLAKSDTYAWFREDTGEYVSDAYYGPVTVKSTINLDIEKMFEYHKSQNSELYFYTLDDFKSDLQKDNEAVKKVASVGGFEINSKEGSVSLISGDTSCHIDNESNVLTVEFTYVDDGFETTPDVQDREYIKNATSCSCQIGWNLPVGGEDDVDAIRLEHDLDYNNFPVTVVEA
jgi:hypothetical protein